MTTPAPRPEFFRDFPVLQTERLVLRRIVAADVPALFQIFSDEVVMRFWSSLPMAEPAEAENLVRRIDENWNAARGIEWAITLRGGDGTLVGKCGFHRWLPDHARAEVGYAVARPHWRRGIASEAVSALLEFGFGRMGLHSVEAQTDPGNDASNATLLGLGFRQEGHQRENFRVAGRFFDTALFGLLARDWPGK